MSLINDALKRAKQAQDGAKPEAQSAPIAGKVTEPAMRPVENARQGNNSSIYVLSASLVLVLIAAVVLLVIWTKSGSGPGTAVEAETLVSSSETKAVAKSEKPTAIAVPISVAATPIPAPAPAVVPVAVEAKPAVPVTATNVVAAIPEPVIPSVPQFPALKLQGIFYNPTKPSTVINGKTYFTGNSISNAKITKIEVDKVTLQWNGEERVLETAQ